MGNITSLTRDGFGTNNYTGYNGNRLTAISGFTNSSYGYDANGNLTSDSQKNITLGYNFLNLPQTISGSQNLTYTYNAAGEKLQKQAGGTTTNYIDGIQYTNNSIDFIQTEKGLARRSGSNYSYEYNLSDHLGNVRATFYQNPTTNQLEVLQRDDYYAFGLRKEPVAKAGLNKYLYNGKELQEELGQYDYGARFYDPVIGRWNVVDPLAEKTLSINPYTYGNNNPISMIDNDGKYAVSVHYDITYKALIKLGYSKERADLIAHYSSTYADHPPAGAGFADFMLHPFETKTHHYRKGIDYSKTAESQLEKNSHWHSMMSDAEADAGMTEKQAIDRGLKFGWDNIFGSDGGKDLGKLGQGIHALQDAIAHGGVKTNDHLGWNSSSFGKFYNDLYGSTKDASDITRSAFIVLDVLQGKKANLKDGDTLNVAGMSNNQLMQFLQLLSKQGFEGKLKTN